MAFPGDVPRGAIKLDSDDIEFLQQFETKYWIQAIMKRYSEDLFNALKDREYTRARRRNAVIKFITPKLRTGKFESFARSSVLNYFGKKIIDEIKEYYGDEWRYKHRNNLEEAVKNAAKDIAYYVAEEKVPDVKEPKGGYKEYEFRIGKNKETISAKPFINRLVHKLERTKGKEHSEEISLKRSEHPHGMYGFDLSDPSAGMGKIPYSTSGMQLITKTMARNAITTLLKQNFYQYYGRMPNPKEKINLIGSPLEYETTEDGEKKTKREGSEKEIEEWKPIKLGSKELVDDKNYEEVKESTLAILGLSPNYEEFIAQDYKKNIDDKVVLFKDKDEKALHYQEPNKEVLTFDKISSQKKYDNVIKKIIYKYLEWNPIEKKGPPIPGKHPDGIPAGQKQIVHLPHFKKMIIKNGKPVEVDMPHVLPVKYFRYATPRDPDEKRHGYKKDIVHLHHDEYVKGKVGHFSGASIHPNQNTSTEKPLLYGVKGHSEVWDSVFGKMNQDNEGHYEDIIEGIKQAIRSESRGVRDWERQVAINNMPEIHDYIVAMMIKNIRDKNLQKQGNRIDFAKNKTQILLQQNIHGGGTRKSRVAIEKIPIPSEPIKGLWSPEQEELKRQLHAGELEDLLVNRGRKTIAGHGTFPYGPVQLKAIIARMEKEAAEADKNDPIKSAEHGRIDSDIESIFRDKYERKTELINDMRNLLNHMIADAEQIYDSKKRESLVEQFISKISKKKTIGEMLAAFSKFEIVQKYLKVEKQEPRPITPSQDPLAVSAKSKLPWSQSAKELGRKRNWEDLYNEKKYLALAFNPKFFKDAHENSIENLKNWIEKNKATIDQKEYEKAMKNIENALVNKKKWNLKM